MRQINFETHQDSRMGLRELVQEADLSGYQGVAPRVFYSMLSYIRPCRQFGVLGVVLETLVVVGAETDAYDGR